MRRRLLLVELITFLMISSSSIHAQMADTVFLNAKIVTVDAQFSTAEAIAIRDGKIAAIGLSEEVRKFAGRDTRIVDLNGRTMTPGLIDSHIHVIDPGTTYGTEVSWVGVNSLERGLALVRE